MSLECEQSVVSQHAVPVVGDANESAATGVCFNTDVGSPGIQRVFEQLFDYGCGPLDDLTRCDLVGDRVGENANMAHQVLLNRDASLPKQIPCDPLQGGQISAMRDRLVDQVRLGHVKLRLRVENEEQCRRAQVKLLLLGVEALLRKVER